MPPVGTITVIGAGALGRGIAHAAALGGYRTILEDILPASLRRAENGIRGDLEAGVAQGSFSAEQAKAALGRIEYAGDIDWAAREADLVIEAVPEEMESKLEIFTLLDRTCRPGTILASNTSTLSVSEIATITYREAKIVGMRFQKPVQKMERLEIVRTDQTDDDTLATVLEVGRRMGMKVIVVSDIVDPAQALQSQSHGTRSPESAGSSEASAATRPGAPEAV
jgi:3-hydroxybutyryl-CoA dehydrogenase